MKSLKQLTKMIGAVIVAIIILSLIVSIYSTNPLRVENPQGNTDYVWEPNSLWMNMSEGVSFGRMDSKGFNNTEVVDNPDIILLGSSHIESKNVFQDENTAYYLQNDFGQEHAVYNMGISGHTIYKVCQYLPITLSGYNESVPKYVVIETDDINLTKDNVDGVLKNSVKRTPVYNKGLIATLQKVPAFRLFYHQLDSGMLDLMLPELKRNSSGKDTDLSGNEVSLSSSLEGQDIDNSQYDELMSYLGDLEKQYNTEIVIVFHPFEKLNEDGTLSFINDSTTDLFAEAAQKYGITYIDMADDFVTMYKTNHHVPHGFITGEIGSGHLNKVGHKAFADALYTVIREMEE